MAVIQDRLREQRWNSLGYYASTAKESADRIDALETALRAIIPMTDEISSAPATAERWADRIEETARAALEPNKP